MAAKQPPAGASSPGSERVPRHPAAAWAVIPAGIVAVSLLAWFVGEPLLVAWLDPPDPSHGTIRAALIAAGIGFVGFIGAAVNAALGARGLTLNLRLPAQWDRVLARHRTLARTDALLVLLVAWAIGILIGTTVFR